MRFGLICALGLSLSALGCTFSNPGLISDAGSDAGADAAVTTCGDGVLDPSEQCDDGNTVNGDGCQADCTFTCVSDGQCDDHDPCTGTESCTAQHTCLAGTPLADGASCGAGHICKGQSCQAASCGDGIVTAPEECDDGNAIDGDGCDSDCTFSCVSSDPARSCTPTDGCTGPGTCDDASHVCAPGVALPDGTACPQDSTKKCMGGVCVTPMCGNGIVEPPEQCDDGNTTNGDGCDGCKFSCSVPATDCAAPPACQMATCDAMHKCANAPDPSLNGKSCGSNLVCNNGSCAAPTAVCGNGVVEPGEQCDFGAGNGPNTGCEKDVCTFSCTVSPNSCDDGNPCNGVETCGAVTVGGQMGQKCSPGTPLADGTDCGGTNICVGGMCVANACGNGVRDPGEQCDDHNRINLDGCDATCKFEQDQRINSLVMQMGNTDSFCTANVLGGAISGKTAQNELQMKLAGSVQSGTTSILLKLMSLDDLTGKADPALSLGVMSGMPDSSSSATYDGTSDVDWWYVADKAGLDANRNPTAQLSGAINASTLTTTAGNLTLTVNLGGSPATLQMSNTLLKTTTSNVSLPLTSTNLMTPGHLATENLDPKLQSFQDSGVPVPMSQTPTGELCGDVSANSLRQVLAPSALVGCGFTSCGECYTASNTLLDIIVGGCSTFIGQQINATQPDANRQNPTAPAAGAGPPYTLVENSSHSVTGCKDKSGASVSLDACLADAVYSSFFKFSTDRVIIK
ncbi:MAG TPA: DUF4215 domain-containing protein [Polyangia bacterium]